MNLYVLMICIVAKNMISNFHDSCYFTFDSKLLMNLRNLNIFIVHD